MGERRLCEVYDPKQIRKGKGRLREAQSGQYLLGGHRLLQMVSEQARYPTHFGPWVNDACVKPMIQRRSHHRLHLDAPDVMLWGQRLNVASCLTSFPSHSIAIYTFEIQCDRIGLFLRSGNWNYSYWEFNPSKNRNISFVALATNAVEIFNDKGKKIAQENFQASFQAINATCDLPLVCKHIAICTSSNACSSIGVLKVEKENRLSYLVKVPKKTQKNHEKSNVKKWVLILVAVVNGLYVLKRRVMKFKCGSEVSGISYSAVKRHTRQVSNPEPCRQRPTDMNNASFLHIGAESDSKIAK
ncbi:hypothetical protein Ddye_007479 [Dipteronia dyeriana]|uniref:Uncharacterized protein n=1 Tax=Dipteronia dyeriana TaxID=168575 RepID=A0AAD9XJX5_9ROSI|nr:hypothetical protein Ddye_007479 [Dipteronia dyeriana]